MHFEGEHKLEVPRQIVWKLLNDPEVLSRCTPGLKELILQEEDTYKANFHIKMGPINSTFEGQLRVREKIPLKSYRFLVDVDAKIGIVAADMRIGIEKDGSGTIVRFSGGGNLSGKMARMGQRVLTGVARMFTKKFFQGLEGAVPDDPGRMRLTGGDFMKVPVKMTVNGTTYEQGVEPRTTLVAHLRENLGLTGTHVGCDTSGCGACTVLHNGNAVKSCTLLAVQAQGAEITTVEGLAQDDKLHPVQEGFHQEHGLQCGFCTPGMIMSSVDLLSRNPNPSDKEIRHALEGNFCRCTGYENIVRSVKHAAAKMRV